MANDLTARSVGLQVEYAPSGSLVARSVGIQVEYSEDDRQLTARSVGLQVEFGGLTFTGFTPSTIDDRGGTELQLTGNFVLGESYIVDIDGNQAYGGFTGSNSYLAVCATPGQLDVIVPPTGVGSGTVSVTLPLDPTTTVAAPNLITVEKASYTSTAFGLRMSAGGIPRKVGAASIKDEPI